MEQASLVIEPEPGTEPVSDPYRPEHRFRIISKADPVLKQLAETIGNEVTRSQLEPPLEWLRGRRLRDFGRTRVARLTVNGGILPLDKDSPESAMLPKTVEAILSAELEGATGPREITNRLLDLHGRVGQCNVTGGHDGLVDAIRESIPRDPASIMPLCAWLDHSAEGCRTFAFRTLTAIENHPSINQQAADSLPTLRRVVTGRGTQPQVIRLALRLIAKIAGRGDSTGLAVIFGSLTHAQPEVSLESQRLLGELFRVEPTGRSNPRGGK